MAITVRQLKRTDVTWDDDTQEFVENGKPVDKKKVLAILLALIQFGRASARTISQSLIDGDSTVSQWSDKMSSLIQSMAISSAVLAYGGAANLTADRQAEIESAVATQQAFLDNFTAQVTAGEVAIGDGLAARAEMYSTAAYIDYWGFVRDREKGEGWERRVLGDSAESCQDCIDAEDAGWQPNGALPAIGDSQCSYGCKCTFEFSDTKPDDAEDNMET